MTIMVAAWMVPGLFLIIRLSMVAASEYRENPDSKGPWTYIGRMIRFGRQQTDRGQHSIPDTTTDMSTHMYVRHHCLYAKRKAKFVLYL